MSDDQPLDAPGVPFPPEPEARPDPEPVEDPEAVAVAVISPASAYEAIDTGEGATLPEFASEVVIPRDEAPPVAAGGDPVAPVLDALGRLGEVLGDRLDRIQAQFERELRAESSREKVVDRLHAELQEYKNDLLLKITRPIFVDLIQLHDDLGKMAESLDDPRTADVLRDVQQGIEDVLYRQGVEPFAVDGDTFDPRRQRAVSTTATDDPTRNKTISARLRSGFASGDKVIRPELVSVFSLRRPPSAGADAPPLGS